MPQGYHCELNVHSSPVGKFKMNWARELFGKIKSI